MILSFFDLKVSNETYFSNFSTLCIVVLRESMDGASLLFGKVKLAAATSLAIKLSE